MADSLRHGTVIITGASGKFGRSAIDRLLSREPSPLSARNLILIARKPTSLDKYASLGATVRYGDFDDPASLREAFAGTLPGTASRPKVMLLISSTFVTKRVGQHNNAIEAAKASGVDWIVYTSFAGADPDHEVVGSPIHDYEGQYENRCKALVVREHGQTESILRSSGVIWTALRDATYTDLFAETAANFAISNGEWATSFGEGRIPYSARNDCTACAVEVLYIASEAVSPDTALNTRRFANTYLNLTAELWKPADLVALWSEISGKLVQHRSISPEERDAGFAAMGIPKESNYDAADKEWDEAASKGYQLGRDDMVSFEVAGALGHLDVGESNDMEGILGRKPTTFKEVMLRLQIDWKNL